jgi:NDP-sugar pyrophosphorylase family protein
LVESLPKPILQVAGEPFLKHQLRALAGNGITRVVLCVGYLGEKVERVIGRTCGGLDISYSYDGPALAGTLGALRRALPLLGERFLIMYGDTYLRVDYMDFYLKWVSSRLPSGMVVFRNDSRWDRSNVVFTDGLVTLYDKASYQPDMAWIDYGIGAVWAEALELVPLAERDLSQLYRILSLRRELFWYEAFERFYEIGTPAALAETDRFLRSERQLPR